MQVKHSFKARLVVGVLMLLLAFFGVILTDLKSSGGWDYWKWTVPIYALMALWLSWYERRSKETLSPTTLWHEALHWVALFGTLILVEIYVRMGLLGRSLASLVALTLLALTIFTIGIYVEKTFLLIGIVLALFAAAVAIAIKFFYAFTIPVLFIGIAIISLMAWRAHRQKSQP